MTADQCQTCGHPSQHCLDKQFEYLQTATCWNWQPKLQSSTDGLDESEGNYFGTPLSHLLPSPSNNINELKSPSVAYAPEKETDAHTPDTLQSPDPAGAFLSNHNPTLPYSPKTNPADDNHINEV